jgi:predicted MFS family arabinose efflux permease
VWAVALLPATIRERPPSEEDRPADAALLRLGVFLVPFAAVGVVMYALSTFEGEWVAVAQPFVAVAGALLAWPLVDRAGFQRMRAAFAHPLAWIGLLVALGTPIGYAMIQAAHNRLLRAELHLEEEVIASLSGVIDPLSGVAGALIGGFLADRFGARVVMGGAMAAIAAALLGFGVSSPLWPSWTFLALWTVVFIGAVNAYSAASLGAFMSLCDPRVGATHFAVYMAATNLTYSWAAPFGGSVADRWGYPALFALAAAIQLVTIALLLPLELRRTGRVGG